MVKSISPCPLHPPYKRTVWEYGKANVGKIKADLNAVDWKTIFCGLDSEEMADIFTNVTFSILSENFFFINIKYYATFYYTLTTMQHYKDDAKRSKRLCLPHCQHMKIHN